MLNNNPGHDKLYAFCNENKIELMAAFGSFASGHMRPDSDIDVAVKIEKGAGFSKLDLIYRLDDIFEGRDIDLVVLTADTDPLLLFEIFSRGRALFEKREGIFEEEELRAWKLYMDTEKLRAMQRKYLKEFSDRISNVA